MTVHLVSKILKSLPSQVSDERLIFIEFDNYITQKTSNFLVGLSFLYLGLSLSK